MILITGGSGGIGEAAARGFATQKKNLILVARNKGKLDALAASLKKEHGIEVHPFVLDMGKTQDIEKFVAAHAALLEKVEVLINNAGVGRGLEPIQEGKLSEWDEMIDTNVKGLLAITRAILPILIKKGSGHIVNLGSAAGFYTYPKGNVYCATKAAVRALTEALRLDLSGTGVRVTEVSPGMVETGFSVARLGDVGKAKKVYEGMTPLTAQDVAEVILWCVNRPAHVNIQEVIMYPTDQASTTIVHRRT